MTRVDLSACKSYSDLPLEHLNGLSYSISVLGFDWQYRFVNKFALLYLGDRVTDLIGKNMWSLFPELDAHPHYKLLRDNSEKGLDTDIITISPVTGHRINITGHTLIDCFIFTSSILPKKEEVITEMRRHLKGRNSGSK